MAVQSDGKLVVGGVSYTTISTGTFALVRYDTDGSLDTTFGIGGKATTSFGAKVSAIWAVAIYKSGPHVGKIVAAGDSTASGLNVFALARYNADGSLDTTFDTDGKVTTNFALPGDVNRTAQVLSVAIQSDGKIVAAGSTVKGFDWSCFDCPANNGINFALARYNADGSLDTTFGGTGKVITDIGGFSFGGGDQAYSVAIQSDGKIVAAGLGNPLAQGNSDFALVRYNTDGTLDTSFDTDGKVTTDFGSPTDYGKSVAIQSNGKFVVAGQFADYPFADFALARYNADGSLDTTFDTDGKVTTNFGGWDLGQSMAIQSDGVIVAAGYTNAGGTLDFAVARYNANGSLDTSFDTDGKVTTNFGGGPDAGKSVAIQSDGKIVVAGSGGVTHTDFAVARYGGTEPPSNTPPAVAANNPGVTVDEGQTASMGGTYSDPDSGQDVGITASVGSVTKTGTNSGTWSWSNPAPDGPASYSVTITANDENGGVATTTFSVVVNNVAPTITNAFQVAPIPEGSVSNSGNIVVQATDPAGSNDPLTYGFDCDNNGSYETPAIPSTSAADCFFDDNGSHTVGVQVSDDDLGVTTGTVTAVVTNVVPTAFLPNSPSINEGSSATFTFEAQFDPSNADTTAGFHYSFACDGNVASLATSYAGAGTSDSVSCPFADNGSYTVTVAGRIFDKDNGYNTYTANVNVLNVAPVVTANGDTIDENGTATVSGTITDPGTLDTHSVVIAWGPGEGSTTLNLAAGVLAYSAIHQYLDDNPTATASDLYPIGVSVSDDDGGTGSANTQVTVNNVAPVVNAGADQSLPFGSLVSISAAFTDPGTADTWTYSIDWSDGSPAATGSATVGSPITGSHQYVVAGNRTITVCVTDDDLGKGCDSLTVTFVSGIGKITGGVLRFGNNGRGGFNVQSNDGVTVKGELEYHNGSINLHAHTMTAVAVSPDLKKGWFAGVLEDGSKFVVYVEDNGEPGRNDIFKMWVEGTLLNGDGKLTGGNVQIHKN